jgi:uncharacterized coiled-coil protein SlyX
MRKMTRNSIENRLTKLEQANALTLEEIEAERLIQESDQRIRESQERVKALDARLEALTAQYFEEHGRMPPAYESELPPEGLDYDQRLAWGVAFIAKCDARIAELIAIRDAP